MSDGLTIGIVAEGPTDHIVLEHVLSALTTTPMTFLTLQPDTSIGLAGAADRHGGGWRGVLSWCQAATAESGTIAGYLSSAYGPKIDFLVIHLDADVASDPDIAVERDCPPAAGKRLFNRRGGMGRSQLDVLRQQCLEVVRR